MPAIRPFLFHKKMETGHKESRPPRGRAKKQLEEAKSKPAKGTPTDGIVTHRLSGWADFSSFLDAEVFIHEGKAEHSCIWRGQRSHVWSLSSSLDRLFEDLAYLSESPSKLEQHSKDHLEQFKYAARGRRGTAPAKLDENEWWALGQHFGLATPLLDSSRSPFAAAYFAFEESRTDSGYRAVFGLDIEAVQAKNAELNEGPSVETGRLPILEIIDPLSDENPRLVSQGALFTRSPLGTPVEQWVAQAFEGSKARVLLKIEIPTGSRTECLRGLNRMNINHLSLFPDLSGASRFANLTTELGLRR